MARVFGEKDFQRAISYPFARPERSFHFAGGEVRELDAGSPAPTLPGRRHALIAIGANGSPRALRRKLADLSGDDAEALVITGTLAGYAIAPSAHLAIYGSLPATLLAEPAGAARAALLLVSDAQLAAIGLTEFNYHVVRLPAASFKPDLALGDFEDPLAYVSCHGAFAPAGEHLGNLNQAAVLKLAAGTVLGSGATARDLVQRTIEDYAWAAGEATRQLEANALRLDPAEWEIVSTARAVRSR